MNDSSWCQVLIFANFAVDSVLVYPVLYSLWCCALNNIVINMCVGMSDNFCF